MNEAQQRLRQLLAEELSSVLFVPFANGFEQTLADAGFRRPQDMAWSEWIADAVVRGLTS